MLRWIDTHFTEALNFSNYRLDIQSQEYHGRISGEIAKWATWMDVEMKQVNFELSDPMSVFPFFQNFMTACDSNAICDSAAVWLFQQLLKDSAKHPSHREAVLR